MRESTRRAIRKAERRATHDARLQKRKAMYQRKRATGEKVNINWEIIQCYWRENFNLSECAEVLGITEEEARFEIEIARQNAT